MSLKANPLQTNELSASFSGMALHLAENARIRLREEMSRKHLSQREIAGLLDWSQSRVAKLLTGRVEMSLSDLEALCFALGVSPVEAVRDRGLEFCADMTPTELRVLERIRQLPVQQVDALMMILEISSKTRPQDRRATRRTKKTRALH